MASTTTRDQRALALANRPKPNRSNLRFFRLASSFAPLGPWPRSRRPTRTSSRPRPRAGHPLRRHPAFRHQRQTAQVDRAAHRSPNIDPGRRPGRHRRRRQGARASSTDKATSSRPRRPAAPGRGQAQAPGLPCSSIQQRRWPSSLHRGADGTVRLQARPQRHRERRRARLEPAEHDATRRPVQAPARWWPVRSRPDEGEQRHPGRHQPRPDRRQSAPPSRS